MSVDDIAAQGAEPLFFLDYISIGKLVPEEIDELVAGVAEGCRQARCALLGGEMSEHPGVMEPGEFDLVGFAVGVVDRTATCCPRDVRAGDRVVGIASPGLRCNGYSLARAALLERGGRDLARSRVARCAHHSLADELLAPSVIYAPAMLKLAAKVPVHAFAHITGGGIPGNLARVLARRLRRVVIDRGRVGGAADLRRDPAGRAPSPTTRWSTCSTSGSGMLAVVPNDDADAAVDTLRAAGHDAWVVGEITDQPGRGVRLTA